MPSEYADGDAAMAGPTRLGARAISNAVLKQDYDLPDPGGASGFFWQWGQFVDHDIDMTPEASPLEPLPIPVPAGDAAFDPTGTGTVVLAFNRSAWLAGSSPREQMNAITCWIDASNVYGSDEARARALRTLDGTGRLRTSAGDLLPFNTEGFPNAGGTDASLFLAGDVRANEQACLTAMHTLFVREHNRLADAIRLAAPDLSGDDVYEEARRKVGALLQAITYQEFLPLLIGPDAIPPYAGYDPGVQAAITNGFAAAAYRVGHTLLPSTMLRLDASGGVIAQGNLALRDAFFDPSLLADEGGIEPLLRGLAAAPSQALDVYMVEDVRSFLFGPPGAGGLDLGALNIQRGRDHGLPSYAGARVAEGLSRPLSFAAVTSDPVVQERLQAAYSEVGDIDLWIGELAEDPAPGAMVGPLLRRMLADQFRRLRDGDRFYYERIFSGDALAELRATRLSDVIRRNTPIGSELPDDVFRVATPPPPLVQPTARPLTPERETRLRHAFP
jgi:hypothetical protein